MTAACTCVLDLISVADGQMFYVMTECAITEKQNRSRTDPRQEMKFHANANAENTEDDVDCVTQSPEPALFIRTNTDPVSRSP